MNTSVPWTTVKWHGILKDAYSLRAEVLCNAFCVPPVHVLCFWSSENDLDSENTEALTLCHRLGVVFEKIVKAVEAPPASSDPDTFCLICLGRDCEHFRSATTPYLIYCRM